MLGGLELVCLLAFPVAHERPGEAETDKPCVAAVVGVVGVVRESLAFDFELVIVDVAVAAVDADAEGPEFQAELEFGGKGERHGAVVAVAHLYHVGTGLVLDVEDGGHVEVDEVEAEADRGNQVDEGVLAEELPAEHPVGAVGEPLDVEQGHFRAIAAFGRDGVGIGGLLGNLGRHEVDVEPGEELLVLGTDVHVQPDVPVVELRIRERAGEVFRRGGRVVGLELVAVVPEGCRVHVFLECVQHAAVVTADGDESTDVVLFVETGFGICECAC